MMKLRTLACLIGALAISSAPFVLAVSGGGLPSFPQFLGIGVNTPALTTQGLTVQNVSPNVTAIQAKNDSAHDSEIVVSTSTAGNAQYRATNFGGVNWAWGNTRSNNHFDLCPSATLTGCIFDVDAGGASPTFASAAGMTLKAHTSTAANNVQIEIQGAVSSLAGICTSDTATTCGAGQAANDTDIFGTGIVHIGPTSGATASDYISATSTTVSFPTATTISAPNATTVPWQVKGTIGKCTAKFTMAGAGTPSLSASSTNCAGSTMSRSSVGSYTWTEANITFPSNIICTIDSSSSGPFVFVTSSTNGSAGVTILAVPGSSASVLADPASGAHVTCSAGL